MTMYRQTLSILCHASPVFWIPSRLVVLYCAPAFQQLHWLPLSHRIAYRLFFLMHLVHTGRCPAYPSSLVILTSDLASRQAIRSASSWRYEVPRTALKFGERARAVDSRLDSGRDSSHILVTRDSTRVSTPLWLGLDSGLGCYDSRLDSRRDWLVESVLYWILLQYLDWLPILGMLKYGNNLVI